MYGNDPAKDGDTYTHICQYYVHYAPPAEQQAAFYQESPDRRALTPGQQSTQKPGQYQAGSAGVCIYFVHDIDHFCVIFVKYLFSNRNVYSTKKESLHAFIHFFYNSARIETWNILIHNESKFNF